MPIRQLLVAVSSVVLGCVTAARAAVPPPPLPLVDRVPADAVLYVGWSGSDACPAYEPSHLRAVIGASSVPQVFTSFVPQVVRRVARLDEHAGEIVDRLVSAAAAGWHHPTAFYVGPVDYTGPVPLPSLGLLCDAGSDAGALADQLNQLAAEVPPDAKVRPVVRTYGNLVVLTLLPPDKADALFAAPVAGGLGGKPAFTAALSNCRPTGAALAAYVDLQGFVAAIGRANDRGASTQWPKVRQALGLDGFRQVAYTGGFDGRDWVERTFASTDGRHVGLLSLLDARPLDNDLLTLVPQTADRVAAGRLDLAAGFDAVRDGIATVAPDAADQFDKALANIDRQAGVDLRRDWIGSLGDQWVTYSDRSVGGSSVLGSVLVNRLRDPARFDAAMTQLSRRLNLIVARQLHNPNVEIQFRESPANGVTLHYLAVPLVTPTWAVKNGTLFIGLYPQVVAAAVDLAGQRGPSILQRPEFAAVVRRLGNHPAASLTFTNLPAVAPDGYADLLGSSRLLLGIGDIFGAHPPALVVPPLRQVLPELAPAGSMSWADSAGWHSMAVSPFPGAEILAAGNTGGGGIYQMSMLMGALGQLREANERH